MTTIINEITAKTKSMQEVWASMGREKRASQSVCTLVNTELFVGYWTIRRWFLIGLYFNTTLFQHYHVQVGYLNIDPFNDHLSLNP